MTNPIILPVEFQSFDLNPQVQVEQHSQRSSGEIDVKEVAIRALNFLDLVAEKASQKTRELIKVVVISSAVIVTNSLLTLSVGFTKLTGFSIITVFVMKHLTTYFHEKNVKLAKLGPSFLCKWATILNDENKKITQTEAVIFLKNGRLMISLKNYKIRLHDSFKALIAPISLIFSGINALLWVGTKPLYFPFLLPGAAADAILFAPLALNKEFSKLTYEPLKKLSNDMLDYQKKNQLPIIEELMGCLTSCSGNDD